MGRYHDKRFPGESDEYRQARDELLEKEIDLRLRIEEVAADRHRRRIGCARVTRSPPRSRVRTIVESPV